MKLLDFDYNLPPELIATEPVKKRDQSRLLVLDKVSGKIEHRHFFDLLNYLQPGDLLIANNSKVIPARLIGKKSTGPSAALGTGGKVEVFLSKKIGEPHPNPLLEKEREVWECLIRGRVKAGAEIIFSHSASSGQAKKLQAKIIKVLGEGVSLVEFNLSGAEFMQAVEKIGHIPLPPYIEKRRSVIPAQAGIQSVVGIKNGLDSRLRGNDKVNYQTVYALDDKKGSVAAPTAGLHFTPELLKRIKARGVGVEYLTLHVGLGTFLPVKTAKIADHKIHSEYAEISAELIKKIIETKKRGGRVIAVGTTTTRTLEYVFDSVMPAYAGIQSLAKLTLDSGGGRNDKKKSKLGVIKNFASWVDIFIYPPYKFKVVDVLITNFHLPKSTLLMLVAAMAGQKNIKKAYQEAIKQKYRFYSYGDAMLII